MHLIFLPLIHAPTLPAGTLGSGSTSYEDKPEHKTGCVLCPKPRVCSAGSTELSRGFCLGRCQTPNSTPIFTPHARNVSKIVGFHIIQLSICFPLRGGSDAKSKSGKPSPSSVNHTVQKRHFEMQATTPCIRRHSPSVRGYL